jgi:hypothetical protein
MRRKIVHLKSIALGFISIVGLSIVGRGAEAQQACSLGRGCPPAIDVGCEAIDPRLGCPAGAALTVHVHFDAPAQAQVRVFVASISDQAWQGLNVQGSAAKSQVDPHTILVSPGDATITGFLTNTVPAPVLTPTVVASMSVSAAPSNPARLTVTQRVGDVTVRQTSTEQPWSCISTPTDGDQIELQGQNSSRESVVLLDGRRGADCTNLEPHRIKGAGPLGNLMQKKSCAERVTVFSDNKAVAATADQTFWTDAANDMLKLPLMDPVATSVNVWVLDTRCAQVDCARAEIELARAVFRNSFGGIDFNAAIVAPPGPYTTDHAAKGCTSAALAQLKKIAFKDRERNVYYLPALGPKGWWCGAVLNTAQAANTILIGPTHTETTLAHELGHALLKSGDHPVENTNGFTQANLCNNLMLQGNPGLHLTLGQLFRANSLPQCSINVTGNACPLQSFDVAR